MRGNGEKKQLGRRARRVTKPVRDLLRTTVDRVDDHRARKEHSGSNEKRRTNSLLNGASGSGERHERNEAHRQRHQEQHRSNHGLSQRSTRAPSVAPLRFPHYRLQDSATDLPVAQTTKGYRVVRARDADTFPTRLDAQIASAGQPLDAVRVDA